MSNVHRLLPRLTVNGAFIEEFLAAPAPCCALGQVEERKHPCGFLAIQTKEIIPSNVTGTGFKFGHSLLGTSHYLVVHFAFEFYGFGRYHVLVKPNNPVVRSVLTTMVEGGAHFFFVIGADGTATAFGGESRHRGREGMTALRHNLPRILRSETTDAQYQAALAQFRANPQPPGQLLNWVCRDNMAYLDLSTDRLELSPAAPCATNTPADDNAVPLSNPPGEIRRLAEQKTISTALEARINEIDPAANSPFDLLAHMAPQMPRFKRLMDISHEGELNKLCRQFPGLYRFADLLERLANDIRSGDIEVPR